MTAKRVQVWFSEAEARAFQHIRDAASDNSDLIGAFAELHFADKRIWPALREVTDQIDDQNRILNRIHEELERYFGEEPQC